VTLTYQHLLNKPFTGIGNQDCFKLAIDFFWDNFQIRIPNYARPSDWSSDKLDLMRILPDHCGFETITDWRLKDLRPADVLCIAVGESNPNHFAVYVGDDKIVHHRYGRFSNEETLRDFWRRQTAFILRHSQVPDLRPTYPDLDLRDFLRARNSAPTG
jgi:cell wall-associated NlpC family hydrolase